MPKVTMPSAEAHLYVNGDHRGVSLFMRGDVDMPDGTTRHDLITTDQAEVYAAAKVKEALEQAAQSCTNTSMMNVDSYCGATARMCAERIRAGGCELCGEQSPRPNPHHQITNVSLRPDQPKRSPLSLWRIQGSGPSIVSMGWPLKKLRWSESAERISVGCTDAPVGTIDGSSTRRRSARVSRLLSGWCHCWVARASGVRGRRLARQKWSEDRSASEAGDQHRPPSTILLLGWQRTAIKTGFPV